MALTQQHCAPCAGDTAPLTQPVIESLMQQIPAWRLDGNRITRELTFGDFQAALDWMVAAGAVAEEEGHHPDLHLTGYRNVRVQSWTHAVGGLTENDFILAAKLDQVPR